MYFFNEFQNLNVPNADTVSHFSYAPFFKGPYFLQKNWNQTFSMILYLLTFYLFVDIKNIFRITHAKHSAASKYIFYLRFVLGIIHGDRCDRKTPQIIISFK